MTEANDFYNFHMDREDDVLRSSSAFRPLFERFQASFLPKPTTLEATGMRQAAVDGWFDPKIGKAIDKGSGYLGLKGSGISCTLGFRENNTGFMLWFRLDTDAGPVRTLFVDLCRLFSPLYGSVGPHNKDQEIYDAHYALARRTFYASGLFWLNFFGAEEEARQGGPALAENPYARATRFPNGLLLEVGESGLDAFTPEGERRLLDATRAMPPLPPEPVVAPPPPAPVEEKREAAPIVVVAGVRGFLDPEDHGFWVSKHIDPPHPLDARTLKSLAALPGKGKPAVKRVHVLFSTVEAARANKPALEAIGAHAWFVSPADGKRLPA